MIRLAVVYGCQVVSLLACDGTPFPKLKSLGIWLSRIQFTSCCSSLLRK